MSKCQNVNYFLAHDVYVCTRVYTRVCARTHVKMFFRLTFLTF